MTEDATPHPTPALRQRGAAALRAMLSHSRRLAIDTLWPPTCVVCKSATQMPHGLCPGCWRSLSLIERPYCERLGVPLPVDHGGPLLSPEAMARPPAFDRARSVAVYDDTARLLVTRLKFGDRADLARSMGMMMAGAGRELLADADALVPIPLHALRFWQRRYNQAALLAGAVAAAGRTPARLDWLLRAKRTPPQVGLTRDQRAANLAGAFRVPDQARPALAGARIVLVDDVLTTGATAAAAARVLRRAGAARVDVLTFAHALRQA